MRKIKFFAIALAAIPAALSCNKVATVELPEGTPVSFEVSCPTVGSEGDSEPGTKITGVYGTNKKYTFSWEAGDQIALIAYKEPTAAGQTDYLKMGPFTAVSAGNTTTFTGTVPEDFNTGLDQIWAIYPYRESDYLTASAKNTISSTSDAHPFRYNYKSEIASVQDGTGFPYAIFTSIFGTIKKESGNYTVTLGKFSCGTALVGMNLRASDNIKKIEIQAWHPGGSKAGYTGPHYQPLCGSSIQFVSVGNTVNSGGKSDAILTIKKSDDSCYGDGQILISTRQTVSKDDYGNGELRFTFTNSSDQKAYMVIKLYNESGDPANITGGKFYDFGDLPTLNFK